MKVVKADEMARIEKIAYFRGAKEEEFMERAGEGVALLARNLLSTQTSKPKVLLLCGKGNNAGDAFVAGRYLLSYGINVLALALAPLGECSPLCQLQAKRFVEKGGTIFFIQRGEEMAFEGGSLIIDGVLGTGFKGEVQGLFAEGIKKANASNIPILSIDIPSGVNGNTGESSAVAIRASTTLFLGLPKKGCFLGDAWDRTGKIHVFNFGLTEEILSQASEDFILLDDEIIASIFPPIKRTQHKYEAGYVVGLGGSPGMPGAALLASLAALRSGAGIVRLLHPVGMEAELSGAPYELIRQGYSKRDIVALQSAFDRASSLFIGPGIGLSKVTAKMLNRILPKLKHPCVIDADALTLIASNDISPPRDAILTPHRGEMKRLLGEEGDVSFAELHELSQEYADKKKIILVLKGAPTFIFSPYSSPLVSSRGDPGMATAGSGDVLTGIIGGLLSKKIPPLDAAAMGVYLHGCAGECAAAEKSSYSMLAGDIIDNLPRVFHHFLSSHDTK